MKLYMIMLSMLLFGTFNTILMKIQNSTPINPDDPKSPTFNHPFVQCAIMFVGECLCLILYGLKLLYQNRQKNKKGFVPQSPGTQQADMLHLKTHINPLLLAIPAGFDIVASTLMNIALTMVAASVYQMLRGMIIIITAVMAIIFLKKKLFRHHWSSIVVIFLGVFMVGLAALYFKTDEEKQQSAGQETKPLGLGLLLLAQLFTGGMFIVEEKLLSDYYLDPLKIVGLEGVWGLLMYAVLLPIFNNIPCDVENLCNNGVLENTIQAFKDFGSNPILILLSVGVCFSIACFNAFGVTVTKHASAAQRSTIDTSRTVLIWIFFMAVPIYGNHLEHFKVLQLFGFILLVIGTLVYNEIVILPFLGFDKNTKDAIKRRENTESTGLLDNDQVIQGYAATSPHAGYDSSRNERILQHHMNNIHQNNNLNKTEELSITEESEKFTRK
ncbi:nucleotide-sugar transporter [Stylonychia lemnae]|uniref:Nucleotide-sugar transporter n=1 Tax=Stylonychia lemnae TaxID=5949 RepID=A0A078AWT4_STYLE|nr:nucleotide-sugar transporter [Stylonychia lemnae]|eukprot:CDW86516.1 nucleotide-sugar transporter [Stylonychia lemnae]